MSVICKEAYYNSSTGKDTIRALIWHDDTVAPIGVFQIAHGVCASILADTMILPVFSPPTALWSAATTILDTARA